MKKTLLLLFLLPITLLGIELEGNISKWKEYDRYAFNVSGRNCHIVSPARPLTGNPWVWRARFPDWHTEVDEILLKKGFHVAYIDVKDLYGSPQAIQYWDEFYTYMVQKGFSKRPALEGVSRGGLIALNWAKLNPSKVSCIYLEAPVCDIKSWPGGKGVGIGSKKDWVQAQKAYKTSVSGLMKWDNNPVDQLDALAQAKVPIYSAVSLEDTLVPPKENTMRLMQRYTSLGGPFLLHPMTTGKKKLNGHHFEIETPEKIAGFIMLHAESSKQKDWFELRGGIENSRLVFERTGKGRVAFLGGSITQNPGWRTQTISELKRRFPNTKFDFISAGISSTGSTPGAFRLTRDIFKNGPVDLLFEEAAVNDSANRPGENKEHVRAMEGIVRHARDLNPNIDIVLMHFVDPGKIEDYNNGKTPQVIINHESVAKHYRVPSINLALEVTDRINNGEFTWKDDFKNLHPSPFGQKLYFNTINRLFDAGWPGEPAEDDKITAYDMPEKLDPFCYDKAQLFPPAKGFALDGFKLDPKWKNTVGGGTRAGFVNVPMLVGEKPGNSFKLKFKGTAVGIFVAAGKDAGTIKYRIDDKKWEEQDLYTKWSGHTHLPFLYVLDAELADKEHTLEVKISSAKNKNSKGRACRIVNFAVNGTISE